MIADALNELAARAAPPVLPPAAPGDTGQLARLRWWAASARMRLDHDAPDRRPDPPAGVFAAPRMLAVGLAAGDVVVDEGWGAGALRVLEVPDLDAAGAAQRGADAVDSAVDEGADLILLVTGRRADDCRAALALVSVLCRVEPAKLVRYDGPRTDPEWMAALAGLRDARRAAVRHRASPEFAAEALGSAALLSATGAVLQAAARRTPVLLDGAVALGAAALAGALSTGVARWCATSATGEVGEGPVLQRLGLATAPPLAGGGPPGAAAILQLRAVQMALHIGPIGPDPTMPLTGAGESTPDTTSRPDATEGP